MTRLLLIIAAVLAIAGCTPGSTFQGGSSLTGATRTETPVFSPDPVPQPMRETQTRVILPTSAPANVLPAGTEVINVVREWFPPVPRVPILATSDSRTTASTQPSLSGDAAKGKVGGLTADGDVGGSSFDLTRIFPEKSFKWVWICLFGTAGLIAGYKAIFPTPNLKLGLFAGACIAVAGLGILSNGSLTTMYIGGGIVLAVALGWMAYRKNIYKTATKELSTTMATHGISGTPTVNATLSDSTHAVAPKAVTPPPLTPPLVG